MSACHRCGEGVHHTTVHRKRYAKLNLFLASNYNKKSSNELIRENLQVTGSERDSVIQEQEWKITCFLC